MGCTKWVALLNSWLDYCNALYHGAAFEDIPETSDGFKCSGPPTDSCNSFSPCGSLIEGVALGVAHSFRGQLEVLVLTIKALGI